MLNSNILDQMSYESKHNDDELDYKVIKRQYPRFNNQEILEFVFDRDANLFMRKDKIIIRGAIEIDENYVVENNWPHKLFSQATIEIDSQTITRNLARSVYQCYLNV